MIFDTFPERHASAPQPELLENNRSEVIAQRYDVVDLLAHELGGDWRAELAGVVEQGAEAVVSDASYARTREDDPNARFGVWVTNGATILGRLPVLAQLYTGPFRDFMQTAIAPLQGDSEELGVYEEPADAVEAYSQTDRRVGDESVRQYMDPHTDGRWTGILVVAAPEAGRGGRLVVANNPEATSTEAINRDATYITHHLGTFVCFSSGRSLAHYGEPLLPGAGKRMIITFTYPPRDVTEAEAAELAHYKLTDAVSRVK
jgi:predicted secreted protein